MTEGEASTAGRARRVQLAQRALLTFWALNIAWLYGVFWYAAADLSHRPEQGSDWLVPLGPFALGSLIAQTGEGFRFVRTSIAIPLVLVFLVSAYPLHPRRWTAVLSILGIIAWLLACPLYYFSKQT